MQAIMQRMEETNLDQRLTEVNTKYQNPAILAKIHTKGINPFKISRAYILVNL